LPEFLVPELEAHLVRFAGPGIDGKVFTGRRGGPVRNKAVRETWCQARDRVALPQGFRFHDLRHTANTLAATTGASTRELMHRLGHASSVAALRYQHLTQERDIEVARLLDELVQGAASTRRQTGA
jgi:integrase